MTDSSNPEMGKRISANGIMTNYHDVGVGDPVLLIHGSGPGVSAWANWRLNIDSIAQNRRVIAPDMVGFGYTDRPDGFEYTMANWVAHCFDFLDALSIEKVSVVGNSFGGALALAMAIHAPERIEKIVLMGAVGVSFELTEGLDKVWGYEPSIENMKELLNIFTFDNSLVNDDLARMRYEASIQPNFQESFSSMFPAPRQKWVHAMESAEADIAALKHSTLIIHGYEDRVIPCSNALKFLDLLENAELHIFRKCGHWTQIEHKDSFNQLITGFL